VTGDDPEPELVARIRAEIDEAGGSIPFARFMELALYEPEHGYYRRERPGPGREGADFLTAPETHPIFGAALALQIEEIRARLGDPSEFVVREYAAGGGALAEAVLRGLRPGVRYEAIELNPFRRAELQARVPEAHAYAAAPPARFEGVVLANELLDAFPVHRVVVREGSLREIRVGWEDGAFADVEADPSTPALAARLAAEGIALGEGQQAEISLAIVTWLAEIAASLARGAVIVVDYGYAATDLYARRRGAGTLLGYRGHRVVDDPYANVGRQDLTSHVDFSAVEDIARSLGLDVLGRTSQAEFLVGVGAQELIERVRSDPGTRMEDWLALRAGLGRLLDPRATGAFGVLMLGRGVASDPPLRGLGYRLARAAPPTAFDPAAR
jgi:SAM-dependent MidA family methyltransferase